MSSCHWKMECGQRFGNDLTSYRYFFRYKLIFLSKGTCLLCLRRKHPDVYWNPKFDIFLFKNTLWWHFYRINIMKAITIVHWSCDHWTFFPPSTDFDLRSPITFFFLRFCLFFEKESTNGQGQRKREKLSHWRRAWCGTGFQDPDLITWA